MFAATHHPARAGLLATLLGRLTRRRQPRPVLLDVEALNEAARRDLGLSDGRPHPPRDLLRD